MEVIIMANTNPEWGKIYSDYKKSGLSRGDFIRKHQLSNYAFEKFKKMDVLYNKKETKQKKEPLFVPVKIEGAKEESIMTSKEESSLVLSSGNIQIVVTEQTNQKLLVNVLNAINQLW